MQETCLNYPGNEGSHSGAENVYSLEGRDSRESKFQIPVLKRNLSTNGEKFGPLRHNWATDAL
jgi:hypothetical protein